jgi:Na+-transporting methylmalonyl-CoA/oxaloacetate decarboxylase gamma subunit
MDGLTIGLIIAVVVLLIMVIALAADRKRIINQYGNAAERASASAKVTMQSAQADNTELLAVISAAVASYISLEEAAFTSPLPSVSFAQAAPYASALPLAANGIVVRSIKRLPALPSKWKDAGRMSQIQGRL